MVKMYGDCHSCKKELSGLKYTFNPGAEDEKGNDIWWCKECLPKVLDNYPDSACICQDNRNGRFWKFTVCPYCWTEEVLEMNYSDYLQHKKECSEKNNNLTQGKQTHERERERERERESKKQEVDPNSPKSNNYALWIGLGLGGFALIGLIAYFLTRKTDQS